MCTYRAKQKKSKGLLLRFCNMGCCASRNRLSSGSGWNVRLSELGSFDEIYDVHERLGFGAYSEVFRVTKKSDGSQWAAKRFDKSELEDGELDCIFEEARIVMQLKHTHIIRVRQLYDEEHFLYLVSDLLAGGELVDRVIQKDFYSEADARDVMRILLQAGRFRRADTVCGTPKFVAPEVIDGQPYLTGCDVWSLGVIAYILLCGLPPFNGEDEDEVYENILETEPEFRADPWPKVSGAAVDFVKKMLHKSEAERPSAARMLRHPWIADPHGRAGHRRHASSRASSSVNEPPSPAIPEVPSELSVLSVSSEAASASAQVESSAVSAVSVAVKNPAANVVAL
eukprot:g1827.t1